MPTPNLARGALIVLALFVGRNFIYAQKAFLNIPYRDSWQIIDAQMSAGFPLAWWFSPHNEHLIATTKFFTWLLYHLNNWNVSVHLYLNYCLYLVALATLYFCVRKSVAPASRVIVLLSFAFAFSDTNWENLTWEFQSTFHFFLLFSLLTIYLLAREKLTWPSVLSVGLLNFLSVLSLSSAVASSLALLCAYLVFYWREEKPKLLVLGLSVVLAVAFWLSVCQQGVSSGTKVLPFQFEFWDFLLNLVSFGFGFETYSMALGGVCIAMVIVPILYAVFVSEKDWRSLIPAFLVLIFVLATLSTIAIGRGSHADLHIWSKGGRYFEIAYLLVPLSAVFWLHILESKLQALLVCLLLPVSGFLNNWSFELYSYIALQKKAGIVCVSQYSEEAEAFTCPEIWGEAINSKLELSKQLNLSFVKEHLE